MLILCLFGTNLVGIEVLPMGLMRVRVDVADHWITRSVERSQPVESLVVEPVVADARANRLALEDTVVRFQLIAIGTTLAQGANPSNWSRTVVLQARQTAQRIR